MSKYLHQINKIKMNELMAITGIYIIVAFSYLIDC